MLECANNIQNYINIFHYDPHITLKNLIKQRKISQEELAFTININVRTLKRYLSGEYELNKKILALICCAVVTPHLVTIALFKNAGLDLNLLNKDPILFDILERIGREDPDILIEEIYKNF